MRSDQQALGPESGLAWETVGVVRAHVVTEDERGRHCDWKTAGERGPRPGRAMSCLMAGRDAQSANEAGAGCRECGLRIPAVGSSRSTEHGQ